MADIAGIAAALVRSGKGIRGHPLRRDLPAAPCERSAVPRRPGSTRAAARDQGGHRHAAADGGAGRDRHRGPGRPAGQADGVRDPRRTFCQVAGGIPDRRPVPDVAGDARERPCPDPLRVAVPRGRPRANRRARSPHGWRPCGRAPLSRHGGSAVQPVRGTRVACNLAALRGGYRPADAQAYSLA